VTGIEWLVDKSALWRVGDPAVAAILLPLLAAGQVGVSIATELEVGYSAQSAAGYRAMRSRLVDHLIPIPLTPRAENRAINVQAELIERGEHRGVSIPDLLIAATADVEGLVVLHYDADFDLIAEITGQPVRWVVPRGSIS
jgi:predicted nucleic acid-binding protein